MCGTLSSVVKVSLRLEGPFILYGTQEVTCQCIYIYLVVYRYPGTVQNCTCDFITLPQREKKYPLGLGTYQVNEKKKNSKKLIFGVFTLRPLKL